MYLRVTGARLFMLISNVNIVFVAWNLRERALVSNLLTVFTQASLPREETHEVCAAGALLIVTTERDSPPPWRAAIPVSPGAASPQVLLSASAYCRQNQALGSFSQGIRLH